ncbi:MAG: hypothetical protein ACLUHE_08970 [Christensenellales bacterium]
MGSDRWAVTNKTEHFYLIGSAASGTTFRDSLSDDYQKLFADTLLCGRQRILRASAPNWSKQYEEENGCAAWPRPSTKMWMWTLCRGRDRAGFMMNRATRISAARDPCGNGPVKLQRRRQQQGRFR